jgi:hypothetical protein
VYIGQHYEAQSPYIDLACGLPGALPSSKRSISDEAPIARAYPHHFFSILPSPVIPESSMYFLSLLLPALFSLLYH